MVMVKVRVRVRAGKTCCRSSVVVLVLVVCSMCIRGLEVPRFPD